MIPRLDLAFSYWIFAWYLLYIFKIIKYNPLCFLIIALIFDIIFVLVLIYYKNSTDGGINWSSDIRLTFNTTEWSLWPRIIVQNNEKHILNFPDLKNKFVYLKLIQNT
jgi:hypothetical protein